MMHDYILSMNKISKRFPGVLALNNVSFQIRRGEVHALIGENGAGKSTLMKILSGVYQKDEGEITVNGKVADIKNTVDATDLGISIIHQEFNLVPTLSVAENIYIGRLAKGQRINWKEIHSKAAALLDDFGFKIDIHRSVESLSVAEMQMVEIAKALSFDAKIIVMDEPSATLTERDLENFFKIIKTLQSKRITIIYISHRLEEIFEICSRMTIMRDGNVVCTMDVEGAQKRDIIEKMVGRSIENEFPSRTYYKESESVLRIENLTVDEKIKNISFDLKKREILGISGLVGAGRTELLRAVFGADCYESGEISVDGKKITVHSPASAKRNGMGFVPEDRKLQGVVLRTTVKENITLPNLKKVMKLGILRLKKEESVADEFIAKLQIKTPKSTQLTMNLSGGNQQKIVIAKWLFSDIDILVLDEPTRGIDVGSKYEIYQLMNEFIKEGKSIIMISSEFPEVLAMSDRVLVMHNGEIKGELKGEDARAENILHLAIG